MLKLLSDLVPNYILSKSGELGHPAQILACLDLLVIVALFVPLFSKTRIYGARSQAGCFQEGKWCRTGRDIVKCLSKLFCCQ